MRSLSVREVLRMRGTFLHEGIDCIEQNPVIGIPDSQNLLCFLFAGVIK